MPDPVRDPVLRDWEVVLRFWFGDDVDGGSWKEKRKIWFASSAELDARIDTAFGATLAAAAAGELAGWAEDPRGRLALVVVLDQFSRNLGRGTAAAFANDDDALRLAVEGVERGQDQALHPVERVFLYMPAMHSERLEMQRRGVELFEALTKLEHPNASDVAGNLKYAREHCEVIERFGRFPHRNAILGRIPTPQEVAYLESGGATYGQRTKK